MKFYLQITHFYADISDRIMSILKKNFLEVEVYSIDEAFFNLNYNDEREVICSELSEKILKWTGISVSIGNRQDQDSCKKYLIE